MEDFQKIYPVTKAKRYLLDIIKNMEEEDETIAITKNGEPVGVMMGISRYEALLETIEILSDKHILESLEKSERDFAAGRTFAHDDVWEE